MARFGTAKFGTARFGEAIGVGFIRGINKDTNISIGIRKNPQIGKNKDTNTIIGIRKI